MAVKTSICAECAHLGRDCCHYRGGMQPRLTAQDCNRIVIATGRPLRTMARRGLLRVDKHGACVMLGTHGCTLPIEARPMGCRCVPWGLDEQGNLYAAASADECLAVERCRGSAIVLAGLLGTTLSEVRRVLEQAAEERLMGRW